MLTDNQKRTFETYSSVCMEDSRVDIDFFEEDNPALFSMAKTEKEDFITLVKEYAQGYLSEIPGLNCTLDEIGIDTDNSEQIFAWFFFNIAE